MYWNSFLTLIPAFKSSRDLNKIIQNCFCFLFLLVCCIPRVTQLKSWIKHHVVKTSLHLITFNQFQNQFKNPFTTKNHHTETICCLYSRCRHSHNRRVQKASFIETKCTLLIIKHNQSAFHVLLYGWLYKLLVSFSHFFPRQFSQAAWRNFYMN